ncbi:DUF5085 family protein [Carnobacterium maltaromaticum]|nr:hypothetical protein IV75_GL002112 [Carnobacterium maltaromaticum]
MSKMKPIESAFVMNNLIKYEAEMLKKDWQKGFDRLNRITFDNGLYQNGPLFFSINDDESSDTANFVFYLPVCWKAELEENPTFSYQKKVAFEDTLSIRQAESLAGFPEAIQLLKETAEKEQVEISNDYYCVFTEVYGEMMIDVHVPILEESD